MLRARPKPRPRQSPKPRQNPRPRQSLRQSLRQSPRQSLRLSPRLSPRLSRRRKHRQSWNRRPRHRATPAPAAKGRMRSRTREGASQMRLSRRPRRKSSTNRRSRSLYFHAAYHPCHARLAPRPEAWEPRCGSRTARSWRPSSISSSSACSAPSTRSRSENGTASVQTSGCRSLETRSALLVGLVPSRKCREPLRIRQSEDHRALVC
mmetsp:Transcript_71758/g.186577  ORF Transcript_71758/g.186577 Transcript_71758/m.186577 type:complete len:207 (+) Transcript_71758:775-1395(+)